jgi:3-hydroxybutyryl-CoA dehydrogenase
MPKNNLSCGVVGAGAMGNEIAFTFALAGWQVFLMDRSQGVLDAALARLGMLFDKGAARNIYNPDEKTAVLGRIVPVTDVARLSVCSFVTEAVFESEAVKSAVFRALDEACAPGCIIATNTSTIPIAVLAAAVAPERRERFIGTHYFSPVSRMKLVEVIPALNTAQVTIDLTMELCTSLGKTPVLVKDVTGFAVNRLLHVLLIEAVRLVEEGVATPQDIDLACRLGLGHPMGPFELMDATTSSLCLQAQEIMFDAYGERFRPRPLLKQRVRAGLVGGRSAPGWRK